MGAAEPDCHEVIALSDPEEVAITWFGHRRTENLCRRLGWTYQVIETRSRGVIRYLRLAPRTVAMIARRRPRVLVVQNPSLVLATLCVVAQPFFRYLLVVDAHNQAVQPFLFDNALLRWLSRLCLRRADLTIVTNDALARIVEAVGGTPFVLPDPLPEPPPAQEVSASHAGFRVVVISTFSPDEPLEEILGAASRLGEAAQFSITGNVRRLPQSLRRKASDNVTFTGFLAEAEYWALLRDCDVVVDLSLMPDCLVCGAYEAIAVRKPVIVTDSVTSRAWFRDAAIYTSNDADSIERVLRDVRHRLQYWTSRVADATPDVERAWEERGAALRSYLSR
jgi:glycosyltransferase involved in cell wall biosynthesis